MCEQACIFLVFCVPALPKLFMEQGITTRIAQSWQSWIRLPHSLSTKPSNKTLRRHDEGVPNIPQGDAYYQAGNARDHISTELRLVGKEYISQLDGTVFSSSDLRILKTVEFDTREDAVPEALLDYGLERQHPWMNARV